MEELIRAIIDPMISNKSALMIKEMPSLDNPEEKEVIVIAEQSDIAKLIGKSGIVANAIREVVSIKSRLDKAHIRVKFESYDEEN